MTVGLHCTVNGPIAAPQIAGQVKGAGVYSRIALTVADWFTEPQSASMRFRPALSRRHADAAISPDCSPPPFSSNMRPRLAMWVAENNTRFRIERGFLRDRNGGEVWITVVKGTFDIRPDGTPAGGEGAGRSARARRGVDR